VCVCVCVCARARARVRLGKVAPVLTYAPRHEDVMRELRCSSTHS
jgi:hypothetical protein